MINYKKLNHFLYIPFNQIFEILIKYRRKDTCYSFFKMMI